MRVKFNSLNHKLETDINKQKIDKNIVINIEETITSFDNLYNDLNYQFPSHIKNKIIKKYGAFKKLPNSLQVDFDTPQISIDMV